MTPGTVKDSGSLKAGAEIRSNFEMNGEWQSPKSTGQFHRRLSWVVHWLWHVGPRASNLGAQSERAG